ncbi:MAG TPA: hypothetical protein VN181_11815, partial [Thermoanaerobaculia bacterium]|nr:hypothetical protein [Thermoanaerobaculia bacterium]
PPAKSKAGLYGAIAAVVVIALAAAGWFATHKDTNPPAVTQTVATSGTQVVSTAAPTTTAPIAEGKGVLLLSATPWGDIEKIVDASNQREVPLTEDARSTPARIELDPGKYTVTLSGPNQAPRDISIEIKAGKRNQQIIDLGKIDFDALAREMNQQ